MYYKWLDEKGRANDGKFAWPLPKQKKDGTWTPGKWVIVTGKMRGCTNTALHGCRMCDISTWAKDGDLYEFEMVDAVVNEGNDKVICQKARLLRPLGCTDKIKRLWACDMAEEVLPFWESEYPEDISPRLAIQAGRDFAYGKITAEEMENARARAWESAWASESASASAIASAIASAMAGESASESARASARAWASARERHGQMLLAALGVREAMGGGE